MNEKGVIFLVLARAGSTRLPGKNINLFADSTLLNLAIEQSLRVKEKLREYGLQSSIVVSTDIDRSCLESLDDVVFIERPPELATSDAGARDAITHALENLGEKKESTVLCLLQPTSPIRYDMDILKAIDLISGGVAKAVVSVSAPMQPLKDVCQLTDNRFNFINIDKESEYFFLNGGIYCYEMNSYVADVSGDLNEGAYLLECSPETGLDIDHDYQFEIAEVLFRKYCQDQRGLK